MTAKAMPSSAHSLMCIRHDHQVDDARRQRQARPGSIEARCRTEIRSSGGRNSGLGGGGHVEFPLLERRPNRPHDQPSGWLNFTLSASSLPWSRPMVRTPSAGREARGRRGADSLERSCERRTKTSRSRPAPRPTSARRPLLWWLTLGVAVCFLIGAIGYFVGVRVTRVLRQPECRRRGLSAGHDRSSRPGRRAVTARAVGRIGHHGQAFRAGDHHLPAARDRDHGDAARPTAARSAARYPATSWAGWT